LAVLPFGAAVAFPPMFLTRNHQDQTLLLLCSNPQANASASLAIVPSCFCKESVMSHLFLPLLADYIWIGGGSIGLIVLIVIVVLVLRG
jgi:hypothetical protein